MQSKVMMRSGIEKYEIGFEWIAMWNFILSSGIDITT